MKPGLYKNGKLVYDWDYIYANYKTVNAGSSSGFGITGDYTNGWKLYSKSYTQYINAGNQQISQTIYVSPFKSLDGDLVLPEKTEIYAYAFEGCTNLTSVTIQKYPDYVHREYMGVYMIGNNSFKWDKQIYGISKIYFIGTVTEWNNLSISSNAIPSSIEIYCGLEPRYHFNYDDKPVEVDYAINDGEGNNIAERFADKIDKVSYSDARGRFIYIKDGNPETIITIEDLADKLSPIMPSGTSVAANVDIPSGTNPTELSNLKIDGEYYNVEKIVSLNLGGINFDTGDTYVEEEKFEYIISTLSHAKKNNLLVRLKLTLATIDWENFESTNPIVIEYECVEAQTTFARISFLDSSETNQKMYVMLFTSDGEYLVNTQIKDVAGGGSQLYMHRIELYKYGTPNVLLCVNLYTNSSEKFTISTFQNYIIKFNPDNSSDRRVPTLCSGNYHDGNNYYPIFNFSISDTNLYSFQSVKLSTGEIEYKSSIRISFNSIKDVVTDMDGNYIE